MPRTCCVPSCKSNYNSKLAQQGGQLISVFQFPKDENLRQKWVNAIPRSDWVPSKYAVVCCMHFQESDIIREDIYLKPDGTLTKIPIKSRLKPNACPCIFPNLPKYLSKTVSTPRKTPEERKEKQVERNKKLNESFERSDFIQSFADLILNFNDKINISENWTTKVLNDSKICFYTLNLTTECIRIVNQISIDTNMVVKIFVNANELTFNDLKWILPFDMKLTRWSQLENLLCRYKSVDCDQSQ